MIRRVLNWHTISDATGKLAYLGVQECGHLFQLEGAEQPSLPTRMDCGVCDAEAAGAPKPGEAGVHPVVADGVAKGAV